MSAARFGGSSARREPRASWAEIAAALRRSFWALLLPLLVLGGMYFGVFTATEAAAIGALGALVIAMVVYRNFTLRDLWISAQDAARNTAMLFMILAAAAILGNVLTKLRIPNEMVDLVLRYEVSQLGFLAAVMALIFVLGMFLETISIILITTPVVLPVLAALKIHPVWYGILLDDQPRTRADHAARRHEPVRAESDHARADPRHHPRRRAVRPAVDRRPRARHAVPGRSRCGCRGR